MEPVVGAEIGKRRPVLVVSNDESNQFSDTVTIVPLTSQPPRRKYLYEVIVPQGTASLSRASRAKANQIRTISKLRLLKLVGDLPSRYYPEIHRALAVHLNMDA